MAKLKRLTACPPDWDQKITQFPGKTLFHETAWHRHLLDIHPRGRMEYFEIVKGEDLVGLHCGLRIRKMLLPIHGSPLGGTGTNFMGPIFDPNLEPGEVIRAVRGQMGPFGVFHIELSNPLLAPQVMEAEGFQASSGVTNLCNLPSDEEAAWSNLKGTARNRIRKAEKNGLAARITDDPELPDLYFRQLEEVYGLQGLSLPFGVERPRSLHRQLMAAGRILPVEVVADGRTIASGLFPFDENCVYYWGGASWAKDKRLNPNELLHWTVIKEAVARGIPRYNLCGGQSRFKDKFGGSDVPYITYHSSITPLLSVGRKAYRTLHFKMLRWKGSFSKRDG